jgi:hypothetical protein
LALTLLTSNAQRQAPLDPAARPKPVMLLTAILADPFVKRPAGRRRMDPSVHLEFSRSPAN